MYLKEFKVRSETYLNTQVRNNIICNKQKVKVTQVSINRWTGKQNVVYPYKGILLSLKGKEILSHATTWMNLKRIRLS